jgi:hypothetical protein
MNLALSLKTLALLAFVAASTVAIVKTGPVASSALAMAHTAATVETLGI